MNPTGNRPDNNLTTTDDPRDTPFDNTQPANTHSANSHPAPAATAPYDPDAPETARTPATTTARRGFPIKAVAIAAVVLLLLGGLIFQYRRSQAAKVAAQKIDPAKAAAANIQVVSAVPVSTRNVLKTITVTGSLRALQNIDLSSKLSGRVARVAVQEGDEVQRGQLLIALEDDDLRAQVDAAQAAVRTAQVRLNQQRVGLPARVADINTTIEKARTTLASSQTRLAQARSLEPSSVQAAQAQLDNARQTVKTSQARLNQARTTANQTEQQVKADIERATAAEAQARAALQEVEAGSRKQQIAQAEAQVREAQVRVDDAKTELDRAKFLFAGDAGPKSAVDTAQTQYNVALVTLESARQNLSLVNEGPRTEQVTQAQQALRQAQAQVATAESGRARVPIAQSEITTALAALAQAQEGVNTAQANLSAEAPNARRATRIAQQDVEQAQATLNQALANRTNIPVARADIAAAEAGVESANAQLNQAQINLANARIYAPVSGVINRKLVDVGQSVSPATALLNLVATDAVYFEAGIPETQLRDVEKGDRVQVTIDSVSAQPLAGFVADIIRVADPQSRQFRLRIAIPDQKLTPGAFARGQVVTDGVYNALAIRDDAIIRENNKAYVIVAEGEGDNVTAQRREVKTGLSAGDYTQIVGGLQKGDRVISGSPLLKDGDKVRISKDAAATDTIAVAGA